MCIRDSITSDLEKCADHITYIQNGRIFASRTKKDFLAAYVLAEGTPEQDVYKRQQ